MPIYFTIFGAAVILDQVSKHALVSLMAERGCRDIGGLPHFCEPIVLLPFFDLVMVWNRGVSFGLFANDSAWGPLVLGVLNLAVGIGLLVWLWRGQGRLLRLSLALVAGGAIGNAIDRFVWGAVADFFDVHADGGPGQWLIAQVGTNHWPAFNVADICIVIGVIGLIVDSLFAGREPTRRDA